MIGLSVALQFIQTFKTPTNKNSWVKQNFKVEQSQNRIGANYS